MNRTLTTLLAVAAVVGVTGGTFAATRGIGEDAPASRERPATGSSSPTSDVTPTLGSDEVALSADPRAGDLLWIEPTAVHDGDTVVRLDAPLDVEVDTPVALQRFRDGWILTEETGGSYEAVLTRTSIITPRGGVYPAVDHVGLGDVSPDGTRFVAQALDGSGYAVYDITTSYADAVAQISGGRTPGQHGTGQAQFVDDDTVVTGWTGDDGLTEVLEEDLGSDEQRVVTDGVVGPWGVSPDGRWLAASLPDEQYRGDDTSPGCVVVRPVDASGEGRTDCGGRLLGVPSFTPDSSAVLTVPTGFDGVNSKGPSVFRQVPTGDGKVPARIVGPDAGLTGVYLTDDRVAVLGSRDKATGEGTRIDVCTPGRTCERAVESALENFFVILGS